MLVSLFAGIAGLLDVFITTNFGEVFPAISVAMVLGVAIISSNTLLYSSKSQIKGLTTAVALWLTSILGISFGFGFYTVGIIAFICVYVLLNVLTLERYLKDHSNHFDIHELKNQQSCQFYWSY